MIRRDRMYVRVNDRAIAYWVRCDWQGPKLFWDVLEVLGLN